MEQNIGDRIKSYEKKYECYIPSDEYLIIRIDGHHFSKFTKGFEKPFDDVFREAMVRTAEDLHERFSAYTTYTQSDEITLLLPVLKDKKDELLEHQFKGRTQKIASLASAFTTVSFNKHLRNIFREEEIKHREFYDDAFRQTPEETESKKRLVFIESKFDLAYFDARVFSVPDIYEATNIFIWRGRDCIKNSKSTFARAYASHQSLDKLNSEEQIQFVKDAFEKDWNDVNDEYKYGVLLKKEQYEKDIDSDDTDYCVRSRIVRLYKELNTYSDKLVDLIEAKYIDDGRL